MPPEDNPKPGVWHSETMVAISWPQLEVEVFLLHNQWRSKVVGKVLCLLLWDCLCWACMFWFLIAFYCVLREVSPYLFQSCHPKLVSGILEHVPEHFDLASLLQKQGHLPLGPRLEGAYDGTYRYIYYICKLCMHVCMYACECLHVFTCSKPFTKDTDCGRIVGTAKSAPKTSWARQLHRHRK